MLKIVGNSLGECIFGCVCCGFLLVKCVFDYWGDNIRYLFNMLEVNEYVVGDL